MNLKEYHHHIRSNLALSKFYSNSHFCASILAVLFKYAGTPGDPFVTLSGAQKYFELVLSLRFM